MSHVVFVCSGNICRSPMAELVFRAKLAEAGLEDAVTVSSAGIGPWHRGEPADQRAQATLKAHGYPTQHVASQVDDSDLEADLLLAADEGHLDFLRARVVDPSRVRLLREFDPTAKVGAEVPDPYYGDGDGDGFEDVLAMIERAMPGLIAWVRTHG
ncbi:low molecular weight protein-tyrosine-phosphatase [Amycolatopsis sp. FDAARGOS 1241]|uniref:low molecular weight protein-tyrosine-phosphatase n=1 Tax=Amycolatopsis sp. FDAARGOS 1241 TaxID=2778070 RepID=UPI002104DC89|nr:low molecular weight protein-tyrosine-phosphatase [Amycolatopsis sp. FDAARGOS 1241]